MALHSGNGIPDTDLIKIRNAVAKDPVAIDKWARVVDNILDVNDATTVKRTLRVDFEEGVLKSLRFWNSRAQERIDLIEALREYGLDRLADKILVIMRPPSLAPSNRRAISVTPEPVVPLPEMEPGHWAMDEAVRYIQDMLMNSVNVDNSKKLAEKLGRVEFAVKQAVIYIKKKYGLEDDQCIVKYLNEYAKAEPMVFNDERFKGEDKVTLITYTTWYLTLNMFRTTPGGPSAINVLQIIAYLNPEGISMEFIRECVGGKTNMIRRLCLCDACTDVAKSIKFLERFSVIYFDNEKVSMKPYVQKMIRMNAIEDEVTLLKLIVEFIKTEFKKDPQDFNKFTKECTSHALHLFQFQVNHTELMRENVDYVTKLCDCLLYYGNSDECLSIYKESIPVYERRIYDVEHIIPLRLQWRMAEVHFWLKSFYVATEILEFVLPIVERTCGVYNPFTLDIISRMADIVSAMGYSEIAVREFDYVIPIRVRRHGEKSKEVLFDKHNKANVLFRLGRLEESMVLYRYVYKARKNLYGKYDWRTKSVAIGIGDVLNENGKSKKALQKYERACTVYKRSLGKKHPATLDLNNRIESWRPTGVVV